MSLAAAILFAGAVLTSGDVPATADGWREAASVDLRAIHDTLRDVHPAMAVQRDSGPFRHWLEKGYREGLAALPKVRDARGYYFTVRAYAAGFRDAHISAGVTPQFPKKTNDWPGLATRWDGRGYVVSVVDPSRAQNLPPVGARLLDCNGQSAELIARQRLDLYEGDLRHPYGRTLTAHLLLWDRDNPFTPLPKSCRFENAGRTQAYALSYSTVSPDQAARVRSANLDLPKSDLGVRPWGTRRWWIGLPTLDPGADWSAFFSALSTNLKDIRASDAVVVDLRGNSGGASRIVTQFMTALWGDAMVHAHAAPTVEASYRSTWQSRALFAKALTDAQAEAKPDPQEIDWLKGVLAKLDAARAQGRPLFQMPSDLPTPVKASPESPVRGRVVLLTDSFCVSACLELMDRALAMPNVVHAGTETNADTIFMDVAVTDLPSGLMRLGYGRLAWETRVRPSNAPYRPSPGLTYRDDPRNDERWRAWLDHVLAS